MLELRIHALLKEPVERSSRGRDALTVTDNFSADALWRERVQKDKQTG